MRLFIAIDFPDEIKQELFEVSSELIRQADAGRIVPLENFHITLVFIGESERLQEIKDVMTSVCRSELSDSLRIILNGIGSFKSHKGYNWWVGIEENVELTRLANRLADELRLIGLSIEKRSFKPHITIARGVFTSRAIDLKLPELQHLASTISLMRSDHKNGRQVYRELFSIGVS